MDFFIFGQKTEGFILYEPLINPRSQNEMR